MKRETNAFDAELLELLPRLRRFCFALTDARHDADDLLQATVERLIAKRPPKGADLRKWMFRVCKNLWIDEVRARRVRRADTIDEAAERVSDGLNDAALERLAFSEAAQAMQELPDDQRATLSLVTIEGYSYGEAAEILEVPVGTIMSRLSRARRTLADKLQRQGRAH